MQTNLQLPSGIRIAVQPEAGSVATETLSICVPEAALAAIGQFSVRGGILDVFSFESDVPYRLEFFGDTIESMPAFVLQVSSPGVSNTLSSDKDFAAFKGFDVTVTTNAEFKKKTKFEGTLVGRDAEFVTINLKGRLQKIPIELVEAVRLPTAQTEAGDPYN